MYRYLKILRETSLKDYMFFNLCIADQLKRRFTSYHTKTIFLNVSYENKETKQEVRQCMVGSIFESNHFLFAKGIDETSFYYSFRSVKKCKINER